MSKSSIIALSLGIAAYGAYYVYDNRSVINGIKVPPMPNEAENNKTVAGIDVNTNGVRDDIERLVAEEFGDDRAFYVRVMAYNTVFQQGLISPTKESGLAYVKAVSCFGTLAEKERYALPDIDRVVLNTPERKDSFARLMKAADNTIKSCKAYN